MNRHIVILSNVNKLSPALRYRVFFPFTLLKQEKKIDFTLVSFYSNKTMKILSSDKQIKKVFAVSIDFLCFLLRIIYMSLKKNREFLVKNYIIPVGGENFEWIVFKLLKIEKIYYDIDDAIYLNSTRKENTVFSKFRDADSKVGFWVKKASLIFVSNTYIIKDLKEKYKISDEKFVAFLSAPYENQYFTTIFDLENAKKIVEDIIILWLGSPHTQSYLNIFDKVILNLTKVSKYNVKFILMGTSNNFKYYRNLEHVKIIPWTPQNEYEYMKKSHFGLNPLPDNMFEIRKSAFKVIQYFRAGIIPIVSDVGINRGLVNKYGGYCCTLNVSLEKIKNYLNEMIKKIPEKNIEIYKKTKCFSVENNKKNIEEMLR